MIQSMVQQMIHMSKHSILKKIGIIIKTIVKEVRQSQIFMMASSLAYTTILSIIPLLAVSFAIFQAFGGLNKVYQLIEPMILSNLAHGSSEDVIQILHQFINNTHAGAIGASGLIGLIITGMSLLSSIENSIHSIWKIQPQRPLFQKIAYYWLFITLGPVAVSVIIGAATSYELPLMNFLPNGTGLYILGVTFFFSIFKWVPATEVHWKSALISAVVTSGCWNLAHWGYALYAKKILSYNKIYGGLGAIPVTLLWVYIVWIVFLIGVILTSILEKTHYAPKNKILI